MSTLHVDGLIYNGDYAFAETPESGGTSIDPWGADVITRVYAGATSLLSAFAATFDRSRRVPDSTYPQLFVTNYQTEIGRCFSKLTTTAKGIKNGKPPEPVITNTMQREEVNLEFIDGTGAGTGLTSSFTYLAPVRTYVYYSRVDPIEQRYPGLIRTRGAAFRVTNQNGAAGGLGIFKGKSINSASISSGTNIGGKFDAYNAVAECNGTLESEPIGLWFRVTEKNTGTLVPLGFANSDLFNNIN
jgi:hypothetical protein